MIFVQKEYKNSSITTRAFHHEADFHKSETGQLLVICIKKLYNSNSDFCSIRNLKKKIGRADFSLPNWIFPKGWMRGMAKKALIYVYTEFIIPHIFSSKLPNIFLESTG
ncbi:hypothetical protein RhiirA4_424528 [Rhizophagus irregularis]|uniref:Uncharacterized protein n=1 Tax=Rhizophagus irregularis TaxID=588596 RepID=A0A2I1GY47_9GLOM|nr:hypothetical protein RhiirA4_424528 [Rhizophagus irregularis]